MDPSSYKDVVTSRNLKYHYYFSTPQSSKPVLLFLHGFPSTSWDWHHQVAFFKSEGYGLIVPDMLGYGGTDKPTDPKLYKFSLIAADLVDILNAEQVDKAIVIGHDWGATVASRLANYYSDRFTAFAFLAVSYIAPNPRFDTKAANEQTKKAFGYELYGYWYFFSEDEADKIIESHWDSFYNLVFPHNPVLWKTDLAPLGAAKKWVLADKRAPRPSYLTEGEAKIQRENLLKGGFAAPVCYYKVMTSNFVNEDDKGAPLDKYDVQQPAFFGAARRDFVCLAEPGKAYMAQRCKKPTIKEYDAGHWLIFSHADKLNKDLLEWIKGV